MVQDGLLPSEVAGGDAVALLPRDPAREARRAAAEKAAAEAAAAAAAAAQAEAQADAAAQAIAEKVALIDQAVAAEILSSSEAAKKAGDIFAQAAPAQRAALRKHLAAFHWLWSTLKVMARARDPARESRTPKTPVRSIGPRRLFPCQCLAAGRARRGRRRAQGSGGGRRGSLGARVRRLPQLCQPVFRGDCPGPAVVRGGARWGHGDRLWCAMAWHETAMLAEGRASRGSQLQPAAAFSVVRSRDDCAKILYSTHREGSHDGRGRDAYHYAEARGFLQRTCTVPQHPERSLQLTDCRTHCRLQDRKCRYAETADQNRDVWSPEARFDQPALAMFGRVLNSAWSLTLMFRPVQRCGANKFHFISHAFNNPFSLVVDTLRTRFAAVPPQNVFVWCACGLAACTPYGFPRACPALAAGAVRVLPAP